MNKFKNLNPGLIQQSMQFAQSPELSEGLFFGGLVLDRSPQDLEFHQSPDLGNVRFEDGALRQDFGQLVLGTAATNQILSLGQHKYITSGDVKVKKTFRVFRDSSGLVEIESWNGASWIDEITGGGSSSIDLEDVLLSWKSFENDAYFADGKSVFKWTQVSTITAQSDDFTSANSLSPGDSVDATIAPAGAMGGNYNVYFKAEITGPAELHSRFQILLRLNGASFHFAEFPIDYSSNTNRSAVLLNQVIPLTGKVIASGDVLSLELMTPVPWQPFIRTTYLLDSGSSSPKYVGARNPTTRVAYNNKYTFRFSTVGVIFPGITVGFYAKVGGSWSQVKTLDYVGSHTNLTYEHESSDNITDFGMQVESGTGDIGNLSVQWGETGEIVVHAYNEPTDGDPYNGVTYSTQGAPTNGLVLVDKDPGVSTDSLVARYLGIFAQRVIALQVDEDPQKIAWSISQDPTDWIGDGSGETIRPSNSDQIDPLMALEPLTSNSAALFRENSIERVVQTGVLEPALAFYPWIEKLGTKSPFSVAVGPGGIFFLGSDYEVYYLTESGPTPIGQSLRDELISLMGTNQERLYLAEGIYDSVEHNYILSVPGSSGSSTIVTFLFDMEVFAGTGQVTWYRRPSATDRPAVVDGSEIYITGPDRLVRLLDRDALIEGAYWTSPMLNKGDRFAEYTIHRFGIKYEADDDTFLVVRASIDGGQSWLDGFKEFVPLGQTSGKIGRAFQAFNVTGEDLRVRIDYPSDHKVKLRGWSAEIIRRSRIGHYVAPAEPIEDVSGLIAWWSAKTGRRIAYQDLAKTTLADNIADPVRVWVDSFNGWDLIVTDNTEPTTPVIGELGTAGELTIRMGLGAGILICNAPDLINAVSGHDVALSIIVVYETPSSVSPNREIVGFWGVGGQGTNPRHQLRSQTALPIITRASNTGATKSVLAASSLIGQKTYIRSHVFTGTLVSEWISTVQAFANEDLDVPSTTFSQFIVSPSLGAISEVLVYLGAISTVEREDKDILFSADYTIQPWGP